MQNEQYQFVEEFTSLPSGLWSERTPEKLQIFFQDKYMPCIPSAECPRCHRAPPPRSPVRIAGPPDHDGRPWGRLRRRQQRCCRRCRCCRAAHVLWWWPLSFGGPSADHWQHARPGRDRGPCTRSSQQESSARWLALLPCLPPLPLLLLLLAQRAACPPTDALGWAPLKGSAYFSRAESPLLRP